MDVTIDDSRDTILGVEDFDNEIPRPAARRVVRYGDAQYSTGVGGNNRIASRGMNLRERCQQNSRARNQRQPSSERASQRSVHNQPPLNLERGSCRILQKDFLGLVGRVPVTAVAAQPFGTGLRSELKLRGGWLIRFSQL